MEKDNNHNNYIYIFFFFFYLKNFLKLVPVLTQFFFYITELIVKLTKVKDSEEKRFIVYITLLTLGVHARSES